MGDLKVRDTWVSAKTLLKHVLFLDKLLSLEFVRDRSSTEESDNMAVLLKMIDNGTFRQKKHLIGDSLPSNRSTPSNGSIIMTSTNSVGAKSDVFVDNFNEIGAVCIDNKGNECIAFCATLFGHSSTATTRLPCL